MKLSAQRCFNHAGREAVARCPECSRYFCRECISEHRGRVVCAGCLASLSATVKERRSIGGGQVDQIHGRAAGAVGPHRQTIGNCDTVVYTKGSLYPVTGDEDWNRHWPGRPLKAVVPRSNRGCQRWRGR